MKTKILLLTLFLVCLSTSVTAEHHERKPKPDLLVRVIRISEEFANINTDVSDTTLAEYGITHGVTFSARFGERTIEAFLGKNYKDVPKGDWVALIEDDHKLQIAISYGNAATELGCAVGDTLYIVPKPHDAPDED